MQLLANRLLLAGVLILSAQAVLFGQAPAEPATDGQVGDGAASKEDLKQEVTSLKQAVARLEAKIDRLAEQLSKLSPAASPEFPSVKIRLRSESGQPLAGATVKLVRTAEGAQPVEVQSTTADDGFALDRVLPYGKYRFTVETDIGWRITGPAHVEFGKGLDLIIVAPTSSALSTVTIDSRLAEQNKEALSELRFGEIRRYRSARSFTLYYSPEPGEMPGKFKSFPTLNDGIDQLAFLVRISASRTVAQPSGEALEWQWSPEETERRYLVTQDTIWPIREIDDRTSNVSGEHPYFVDLPDDDMRVAHLIFDLDASVKSPHSVTVPSGETTVWITGVYGRPAKDVLNSLKVEADSDRQIWLPVELKHGSAWIPRLLDTSEWLTHDVRGGLEHLLRKETTTVPSSRYEIVLKSPVE